MQIRPKCNFCEVLSHLLLDQWLSSQGHVILEHLFVNSFGLLITCLNHKLLRKYVCEFSFKAISATSDLLFIIIIIA
jgi:hypothetical protein